MNFIDGFTLWSIVACLKQALQLQKHYTSEYGGYCKVINQNTQTYR